MSMANVATTIRMDDYTKAVLDSAAKYTNQTRTAFMLSAALERAEEVIRERSCAMQEIAPMVLSGRDYDRLMEALNHAPKPNSALLKVANNYRKHKIE